MNSILKFLILSITFISATQLNAFNVFLLPDSLGCGKTTIEARSDCNFNGTVGIGIEGPDLGLLISNISPVVDGSFTFDLNVTSIADSEVKLIFTILSNTPGACGVVGETAVSNITTNCGCNLDIELIISDESCFGCNDGTANYNIAGGTDPITYQWSNGNTGSFADDLAPGAYVVTIKDANDCKFTSDFVISPYICLPFEAFTNIKNSSCYNSCDGSIELEGLTNGNTGFTVLWNDGSEDRIRTNLCAGVYPVVIKDDYNCLQNFTYIIEEPQQILIEVKSIVNVIENKKGEIHVLANGESAPFFYSLFQNGTQLQTSATGNFLDLEIGCYEIAVTDINGCIAILDSVCVIDGLLSNEGFNFDQFNIYPNPAKEYIQIDYDQGLSIDKMIIRNTEGKVIDSYSKINKVNLVNYSPGTYYISIYGNSVFKTYRFNVIP
jgi:hypothetical protein